MSNILELKSMSAMGIDQIDRNSLIDIKDIKIDPSLPPKQRMEHYLKQIKNPYFFMSGDTLVHIRFINKEKSLSQSLINYFSNLKQ